MIEAIRDTKFSIPDISIVDSFYRRYIMILLLCIDDKSYQGRRPSSSSFLSTFQGRPKIDRLLY